MPEDEPTGFFDVKPIAAGRRGTIRRNAYSRKGYTRKSGVHVKGSRVPSRFIPDQGAPGKWRHRHMYAPGIGKLKKGPMKAVGYDVTASATRRHAAVDRAIGKYGRLSTLRKLNAVAVYTRRTSPAKSRTFKSDVRYVQKK